MDAAEDDVDALTDLVDARAQLENAIRDAKSAGLSVGEIAEHLEADADDVQRLSGEA